MTLRDKVAQLVVIPTYGENAQLVASHVQAYIEGAYSDTANRVLVTVNHFPGHGDTRNDSRSGEPRGWHNAVREAAIGAGAQNG